MNANQESESQQQQQQQRRLTIADKYVLEAEIGKGSFATVYKGRLIDNNETKNKDSIAVKVVSRTKLKNKKLLENLEIEIAILKKIKHPHIVGLMDCERTATDFFLIMEYCALGDLTFFIKKRKGVVDKHPVVRSVFEKYPPPSELHNGLNRVLVVNYLQQLASALTFLRSKNLVHRDIKPQNLLLSTPLVGYHDRDTFHEKGYVGIYNLPILKIADFGFARFLPNTSLAETLCGSPLYMAPEILNYQKYNAKADLWSVGTVLYEMCCGRPPFKAANHLELYKKIKKANDIITFPSYCDIEPEIRELICGLLTFDPAQRMGFSEFFDNKVVREDLSRFEQEEIPNLEDKSKDVAESNMFISEYLTKPVKKTSSESDKDIESATNSPQSSVKPTNPTPRVYAGQSKSGLKKADPNTHSDVSIEREYVMVEKKSVEVNALADEFVNYGMALQERKSPSLSQPLSQATQPRQQSQAQQRQQHFQSTSQHEQPKHVHAPMQQQPISMLHRNSRNSSSSGGSVTRRPSLIERRLSISSLSPSSALTRALGVASTRLFGHQQASVSSSPNSNANQPILDQQVFQELTENVLLRAGHQDTSSKFNGPYDDVTVIPVLETLAAKAFVVYSYAEIKFSQILPLPTLNANGSFRKRLSNESCAIEEEDHHEVDSMIGNIAETARSRASSNVSRMGWGSNDLPVWELRRLCTEAIVLYMKSLATLAKAINITSIWWYQSQERNCSMKLNVLVQWIRDKFNECLEKAETLKLKLETKSSLPQDGEATIKGSSSHEIQDNIDNVLDSDEFQNEPVFLEKLIYDRALEISKAAAKLEIQGDSLNSCELAYATSLWMLETVLDNAADDEAFENSTFGIAGVLDDADKEMIRKYIDSISKRLKVLRGKMNRK
ncbi:LAMI_0D07272g1_1 [Lachancea mirantina]|uniref:Serine/threonine-protein kinase ATG1 n=1 Tax=Lachancea mirantina TaxID=1230905 RepID=A0A1G4JCX4_9SACH|nr:LAMI_0D07272g1_1 [Lachancea mirantina]